MNDLDDGGIITGGTLRRPDSADAPVLFPYVYRTRVVEQLAWDGPESQDAFQIEWDRIVENSRRGVDHFFVIVNAASEPVGACSVRVERSSGDLGLWIGEPHQNQGLGTRAIQALVRYSLERIGLVRLSAAVFVGNWASRRAFEKNGFVLERTVEGASQKWGVSRDEWLLELTLT